jgi:hypothetical protein
VKHAGRNALDKLEPLLARVREIPGLVEKSRGVFYARGKAALHFHEDPAGLFADVRPPGTADFERMDVTGEDGRAELLKRLGGPEVAVSQSTKIRRNSADSESRRSRFGVPGACPRVP